MNSASEPRERSSLTSALPASSRRPATTTFAPFLAKATAAARPIPVRAPVIRTTGLSMVLLLLTGPCKQNVGNEALSAGDVGPRSGVEKDFVSSVVYLTGMERP